jgi:hypothetical protein
VGRNPVAKAVGRLGLVARGVVYCIIAGLALRIAFGKSEEADKRGALQSIVRQPFGRFMLVVLAIGLAAYAASCFVKAAAGAAEGGKPLTGASGTAKRVAVAGQGVIYVLLVVTALAVALTGGSGGQGGAAQQDWTAKVLRHPFGQTLVAVIGVALVGIGLYVLYQGVSKSFEENLRTDEMPPAGRRPMLLLGTVGYVARGVTFGLVGIGVFIAAVAFDAAQSVGVDGALKKLAGQPFGRMMLVLVALGLFCFGLFSFVEARYRKVLQA